ncbi:MAG: sulfatase/phosphatase domain-containing protein, partial [Actinomycetota bacterium]
FCHHKAPHRSWEPDAKHFEMYNDVEIPFPDTFRDDLAGRAEVIQAVRMRMMDLDPVVDLKATVPPGLTLDEEIDWRYQRYIKDYLRTIASIDDSVGRLLDHLDEAGLADDTVVVYTSDQGFFLGDHGWFDKRLMYEESLAMPFLVRDPRRVAAGSTTDAIALNVDVAPTFLELAGLDVPADVQGESLVPLLDGGGVAPEDWRTSMYYRYWMHGDGAHNVPAHYGVRTDAHKLICYYNDGLDQLGAIGEPAPIEWELFDLVADPLETTNVIDDPAREPVVAELRTELSRLQSEFGDTPVH